MLEARAVATATAAASNLLEVFVDGVPVMVEPGTTVLQVNSSMQLHKGSVVISDLTLSFNFVTGM